MLLDHSFDLIEHRLESFGRYGMDGFDLLGENGDLELFEHPDERFQRLPFPGAGLRRERLYHCVKTLFIRGHPTRFVAVLLHIHSPTLGPDPERFDISWQLAQPFGIIECYEVLRYQARQRLAQRVYKIVKHGIAHEALFQIRQPGAQFMVGVQYVENISSLFLSPTPDPGCVQRFEQGIEFGCRADIFGEAVGENTLDQLFIQGAPTAEIAAPGVTAIGQGQVLAQIFNVGRQLFDDQGFDAGGMIFFGPWICPQRRSTPRSDPLVVRGQGRRSSGGRRRLSR